MIVVFLFGLVRISVTVSIVYCVGADIIVCIRVCVSVQRCVCVSAWVIVSGLVNCGYAILFWICLYLNKYYMCSR